MVKKSVPRGGALSAKGGAGKWRASADRPLARGVKPAQKKPKIAPKKPAPKKTASQKAAPQKAVSVRKTKASNARRRADARRRQKALKSFVAKPAVRWTALSLVLAGLISLAGLYAWQQADQTVTSLAEQVSAVDQVASEPTPAPVAPAATPSAPAPVYQPAPASQPAHAEEPGVPSAALGEVPAEAALMDRLVGEAQDSGATPIDQTPIDQSLSSTAPSLGALQGSDTQVAAAIPAWRLAAIPTPLGPVGAPMIAVVLDDLGLNYPGTRRAINLPAPLTLSFLTYAEQPETWAREAHDHGHEVMIHVPMEPIDLAGNNPGPNALLIGLDPEELRRRLTWGLDRYQGYVGINNHMGSRFTADPDAMRVVLDVIHTRGLLFLDSVTNPQSVGWSLAHDMEIPSTRRDVFIDNTPDDSQSIRVQLSLLEAVALRNGFAVGIGHPHDTTLDELSWWIDDAKRRGFVFVPISTIVRRQMEAPGLASSG